MSDNMAKCPKCSSINVDIECDWSMSPDVHCSGCDEDLVFRSVADFAQFFPIARLQEERDALLKALKVCREFIDSIAADVNITPVCYPEVQEADAAIKKAEAPRQ